MLTPRPTYVFMHVYGECFDYFLLSPFNTGCDLERRALVRLVPIGGDCDELPRSCAENDSRLLFLNRRNELKNHR